MRQQVHRREHDGEPIGAHYLSLLYMIREIVSEHRLVPQSQGLLQPSFQLCRPLQFRVHALLEVLHGVSASVFIANERRIQPKSFEDHCPDVQWQRMGLLVEPKVGQGLHRFRRCAFDVAGVQCFPPIQTQHDVAIVYQRQQRNDHPLRLQTKVQVFVYRF